MPGAGQSFPGTFIQYAEQPEAWQTQSLGILRRIRRTMIASVPGDTKSTLYCRRFWETDPCQASVTNWRTGFRFATLAKSRGKFYWEKAGNKQGKMFELVGASDFDACCDQHLGKFKGHL